MFRKILIANRGEIAVRILRMQNEIRSPKTGVVERILAKEGQTVNAGEVLGTIA